MNAKRRGISNIICGTINDIAGSIEQEKVEAVGVFDVVEHIENDLSFLREIHSCLAHDGKLYITVPAYNFLWSKEDIDAGHFRRYTLNSLCNVVEEAGFSVLYKTYLFSFLPLPTFLLRTIPTLSHLNRNSNSLENHKKEHKQNKILETILN